MEHVDDELSESPPWGGVPSTPDATDREGARDDLVSYLLSRRVVLAGGGLAMLTALIGADVLHASPAFASTPPANAAAAAALAKSYHGYARTTLTPIFDDAPWTAYGEGNPWCAWFASWFMRVAGVGYQTYASAVYNAGSPVSTPAVGDVCYYPDDGHVGMVVEVVGGVARVVEGNAGDAPGIVKYRPNGPYTSNHLFSRPAWPSGPTTPAEMDGEMIARVVYTGALPYILFTEDWSKPLTGVTGPQVVELNKFLTYDASYYPNGKLGAAVMTPAQFAFFQTTLAAPA
jgi:hypothetical protein